MTASLTIDRMQGVPMRDGTVLRSDVYRPSGPGRRPALLLRTPYARDALSSYGTFVLRAASAGYAVVMHDVRGCGDSDGELAPFVQERDDGYDTIDWIAGQRWCDGNVGMFGASYSGMTQWQAAISGHEALRAIAPSITSSDYHHGWTYRGGAFQLLFSLGWTLTSMAGPGAARMDGRPGAEAVRAELVDGADALAERVTRLPLADQPLLADAAPFYRQWLEHPSYDAFWEAIDVSRAYERISVAALNVGGWYDIFLGGTLENFTGMRARGPEAVRGRQRLLIGPWAHDTDGPATGEVYFGGRSSQEAVGCDALCLRWFDRLLRGEDNGVDAEPPVLIYAMGAGQWRTAEEWPIPGTEYQQWHLHSGGRANTLHGDGLLSRDAPAPGEAPDTFTYDPRDPVPTLGGGLCASEPVARAGAFDQRVVEAREDVLVYTSAPLAKPLAVIGPIKVVLHASSSATDTDWTAKLVDVEPDGYARNLVDGIIRARYRTSTRRPSPIQPGEALAYEIDLAGTANVFMPGHRIRLEISSSNFPQFDRNPNTGEPPGSSATMVPATQTVHHEPLLPSHVVLPIAPADASRPLEIGPSYLAGLRPD